MIIIRKISKALLSRTGGLIAWRGRRLSRKVIVVSLEPCLSRPGPLFPFDPFGFSLIMGVTTLMQNKQPLFRAEVSRHMAD